MTEHKDELRADLDASLRRSFHSDVDPARILARARSGGSAEPRSPGAPRTSSVDESSPWHAVAILAAAASFLLFLRFGARVESVPVAPVVVEAGVFEYAPEWTEHASVGPLIELAPDRELARTRRPDLELIYEQAVAWTSARSWNACSVDDDLTASLLASYGQGLTLVPEAMNQLQGPFSSQEWPTGTILAGFPDNETAVLIAERDSTHRCCLFVELSEDSGLNVFTWPVGDIVLTEISPLPEPRLLDYIAEVARNELR